MLGRLGVRVILVATLQAGVNEHEIGALVKFGIAWSKRAPDESGQWRDVETSFFNVTAWRQLAENVAETLTQGMRVVVIGRLRTNSWETPEGDKRSAWVAGEILR